jgi:peptidoglycan hydrolase-like protein with peptidoglycan-binding domain
LPAAGEDVMALQSFLKQRGFFATPDGFAEVNGYYGLITRVAVARWQRANGIYPSGQFGSLSRLAYLQQQVRAADAQSDRTGSGLSPEEARLALPIQAEHACSWRGASETIGYSWHAKWANLAVCKPARPLLQCHLRPCHRNHGLV